MREADGLKGKKMKSMIRWIYQREKKIEAFRHLSAHFLLSSMLYVIL